MNRHLYDEEALMKDYPLAARTAHPEGTVIPVGSAAIGGENLTLIAGPCAVESREQLFATAAAVKAAGATILRGGTYKPRTSPYAFAGLGEEGLRLLAEAGREFQLPTVSEITDAALLPQFEEIDILQVGARNMQNYTLLQALGRQSKPILLKRGLAATYEEWLASAEYILREGNPHVILCERGIRSYQSGTRATLDLAAIPVMQGLTPLPVLVAHGMAASLVGVLCNLLVVWMVQPALQLGILLLVCSAVPFLAAITNLIALVLSLWLKGLLWLVRCCAALPFASICLPQRYTLFALAVLGALAVCFWHARRLRLYLPAAALCTVLAVGLGVWMQRDVVQINLVGASNNPCVVCVQNGQAVVFFRGGESNWSAVQNYLAGRSRQEPALVVDLRAKPTQMEFSAAEVVTVQELADFTTRPVLDGLTLDLYHNKSANLAVLGVGERHIAVGAGRLALAEPVRVDVLCAPGTLSDSVRPDAILYTAAAPRWLDDAAGCALRYGEDTPGLTLRPGRSMIWEEAQTIAVQ